MFTLKVAALVLRGDDERFPLGYGFFEPMINGIKGILLLGLALIALFSALDALLEGGREIVLGPAVVYGLIAASACWTVALLVRRSARLSGSPLVIKQAIRAAGSIPGANAAGQLATQRVECGPLNCLQRQLESVAS